MSRHALDKLPSDPDALALRREVRTTLDAYAAFLKSPAYQHNLDLAVLTKIAGDDAVPVRERRLAAEVLMKFRFQAMGTLAELAGVREQAMRDLGLEAPRAGVQMTQVNTKIEIVRADDWRGARAEFMDAPTETETEGRREQDHGRAPDA